MRIKILVSAAAGDIGIGVANILNSCGLDIELSGMDITPEVGNEGSFEEFLMAPMASEDRYLSWVENYISSKKIDIFIPTSEAEIKLISELKIKSFAQAKVLLSNELTVSVSLDKHKCLEYLSAKGIKVPDHGLPGIDHPSGYPIILKPRFGRGSKGIKRIDSKEGLTSDFGVESVWQEYLTPDDEEYTCPIFRSGRSGEIRMLIIKRKLLGGVTGSGEVVKNQEIEDYLTLISNALELDGVMNIQLRLTDKGPLLFEINPRLSSTLIFRDKMGFTDLRWWLSVNTGSVLAPYYPPPPGTKFNKQISDDVFYP